MPDPDVVLVVGSLHYDIMVDAPALPRRDETITGRRWYPKFGGKGGNQAAAAARAGAPARMLGAVGDDAFAGFLLDGLRTAGVSTDHVTRSAGIGSGMSVAISDPQGDYAAVIVSGANLTIAESRLDDPALWQNVAVLVLQNEVTEALNLAAAGAARTRGIRVCLNAAPVRDLSEPLAALIDVLVVNTVEAEAMSGIAVASLEDAAKAASVLARRFPVAVVTAGGAGVATHSAGDPPFAMAALPVTVNSTHGAGDVFTGALAAALASRARLQQAVAQANAAAAAHVSRTS